jgi:hypothetical protein
MLFFRLRLLSCNASIIFEFDDRIPQVTELVIEVGFVLKSSYVTSVVISQVRGSHYRLYLTSNTRNPVKNALG